ncbi:flavodoxin [Methanosphaera cuniculi]|uniref:flavodoxin family protein n=1 Tax=Methanosphaera cuniculi TaxID=1077256 RepID=UPI0026EDB868|nr:flavodoxin [Methanosphaera cuniculi]
MKSAVIYYSRTGKTRYVAKEIEKMTDATDMEIKDLTNRSGISAYISCALDILDNKITYIKPKHVDITDYDKIYIGTPVWGSNIAPAIFEIINRTDFRGKDVVTYVTFKGAGEIKALDVLNNLIKQKGGNIVKSFAIGSKDVNEFTFNTRRALRNLENY